MSVDLRPVAVSGEIFLVPVDAKLVRVAPELHETLYVFDGERVELLTGAGSVDLSHAQQLGLVKTLFDRPLGASSD